MSKLTFIVSPLKDSNRAHALFSHAKHRLTLIGDFIGKVKSVWTFCYLFLLMYRQPLQLPFRLVLIAASIQSRAADRVSFRARACLPSPAVLWLDCLRSLQSPGSPAAAWRGGESFSPAGKWHCYMTHCHSSQISRSNASQRLALGQQHRTIKEACFEQVVIVNKSLGWDLWWWAPR